MRMVHPDLDPRQPALKSSYRRRAQEVACRFLKSWHSDINVKQIDRQHDNVSLQPSSYPYAWSIGVTVTQIQLLETICDELFDWTKRICSQPSGQPRKWGNNNIREPATDKACAYELKEAFRDLWRIVAHVCRFGGRAREGQMKALVRSGSCRIQSTHKKCIKVCRQFGCSVKKHKTKSGMVVMFNKDPPESIVANAIRECDADANSKNNAGACIFQRRAGMLDDMLFCEHRALKARLDDVVLLRATKRRRVATNVAANDTPANDADDDTFVDITSDDYVGPDNGNDPDWVPGADL